MPPIDEFTRGKGGQLGLRRVRDPGTGRLVSRSAKVPEPVAPDTQAPDLREPATTGPIQDPGVPVPPTEPQQSEDFPGFGGADPSAFSKLMQFLQSPHLGEILGARRDQEEAKLQRQFAAASVQDFDPGTGSFFQPQAAPDFEFLATLRTLAGR